MLKRGWMGALSLALVMVISACSSRNDDDLRASWARNAYPTLSEDTLPTGPRTNYASQNFFAAAADDSWTYDRTRAGVTSAGALSVNVTSADSAGFTLSRTENGVTSTRQYRRTAEGIVLVNPLPNAPAQAQSIVGEMLWFPQPFYAPSEVRRMVRQGSWGADLNADGAHESFRFTVEQVFLGFAPVMIPTGTVQAAHFRTTTTLLMVSSDPNAAPTMTTVVEDTWWASGLGMVASTVSDGSSNAANLSSYTLGGGRVGGVSIAAPVRTIDGNVTAVTLTHEALVYDAARKRYYASVPGSGASGRIAVIDATSGAVSYADVAGSTPTVLAMATDGSYLHVGMKDTGEVIKLALPGLTLQSVSVLPRGPAGELQYATSLAAWPGNPTFVAVSMASDGPSGPVHLGVGMLRTGQWGQFTLLGPLRNDRVAFDASGDKLFGLQTGAASGVTLSMSLWGNELEYLDSRSLTSVSASEHLDVSAQGVWVGRTLMRTSDLSVQGQATVSGAACRASAVPNRALCLDADAAQAGSGRISVVDPTSLATVTSATYALSGLPAQPTGFVVGGTKQVALRFGPVGGPATAVWLYTSDRLP